MIKGVGTDIVQIERIKRTVDRQGLRFVERILTQQEMQFYQNNANPIAYLAKRFAIKEAVGKALGTGIGEGVSWQHIQTANDKLGAPIVTLTSEALGRLEQMGASHCSISVSDEKDYAVAFAVLS